MISSAATGVTKSITSLESLPSLLIPNPLKFVKSCALAFLDIGEFIVNYIQRFFTHAINYFKLVFEHSSFKELADKIADVGTEIVGECSIAEIFLS